MPLTQRNIFIVAFSFWIFWTDLCLAPPYIARPQDHFSSKHSASYDISLHMRNYFHGPGKNETQFRELAETMGIHLTPQKLSEIFEMNTNKLTGDSEAAKEARTIYSHLYAGSGLVGQNLLGHSTSILTEKGSAKYVPVDPAKANAETLQATLKNWQSSAQEHLQIARNEIDPSKNPSWNTLPKLERGRLNDLLKTHLEGNLHESFKNLEGNKVMDGTNREAFAEHAKGLHELANALRDLNLARSSKGMDITITTEKGETVKSKIQLSGKESAKESADFSYLLGSYATTSPPPPLSNQIARLRAVLQNSDKSARRTALAAERAAREHYEKRLETELKDLISKNSKPAINTKEMPLVELVKLARKMEEPNTEKNLHAYAHEKALEKNRDVLYEALLKGFKNKNAKEVAEKSVHNAICNDCNGLSSSVSPKKACPPSSVLAKKAAFFSKILTGAKAPQDPKKKLEELIMHRDDNDAHY